MMSFVLNTIVFCLWIPLALSTKQTRPLIAKKVLSDMEQAELYQNYNYWTFDTVIRDFKTNIIKKNIVLQNTFLIPAVLNAATILHDIEFVDELFYYLTKFNHENVLQPPNQLIITQFLYTYSFDWFRCDKLLKYWLGRYKRDKKSLMECAHIDSDLTFLNDWMEIMLTKSGLTLPQKQYQTQRIWKIMMDFGISPNQRTHQLVLSANPPSANSQSAQNRNQREVIPVARLLITEGLEKMFVKNNWVAGNDAIIKSLYQLVISKNMILKDTSIIIPVFDA